MCHVKISNKASQTRTSVPPHRVAAGFIESLDKQVNTYLKSLVRSGCRRIKEIQNTAKERAVNTICSGEKNSAMFQAKSHLP